MTFHGDKEKIRYLRCRIIIATRLPIPVRVHLSTTLVETSENVEKLSGLGDRIESSGENMRGVLDTFQTLGVS